MLGYGFEKLSGIKQQYIVQPRYGSDIEQHIKVNGGRLPEDTIYRIALQMLDVYQFVHRYGYVHGNLKASKILLGVGVNRNLQTYLLNYGLAFRFATTEFKPDPRKRHNGTIEYISCDGHKLISAITKIIQNLLILSLISTVTLTNPSR
ncbi:nucleosomal histone kinase 1-like [Teleopsis dalmanni]|uniref:nucleosomal histone kinase 1-like n=1 Tax=Teleopsis dalmanni TaxID=139649 RepID=UPI0018CD6647|nr:nucleosomal histone kinase 1-like [Teleopsis dalmanni]